jgi:hypothetical protein
MGPRFVLAAAAGEGLRIVRRAAAAGSRRLSHHAQVRAAAFDAGASQPKAVGSPGDRDPGLALHSAAA